MQIGSYFGSVLQTLDVNGDSFTDLLLIGAPMFMGTERDEQGQVYVYRLEQVELLARVRVCRPPRETNPPVFLFSITRMASLSTSSL